VCGGKYVDLSFANIQDIDFTLLPQVVDPVDDSRAVNNADGGPIQLDRQSQAGIQPTVLV
jgi:hypothetical protein